MGLFAVLPNCAPVSVEGVDEATSSEHPSRGSILNTYYKYLFEYVKKLTYRQVSSPKESVIVKGYHRYITTFNLFRILMKICISPYQIFSRTGSAVHKTGLLLYADKVYLHLYQ